MSGKRSSQEVSEPANIYNICVQPFPKIGAAKYQISRAGTNDVPVWSHDGKELFYCDLGPQKLVAVSIRTQPSFSFGQSVTLPIEGIVQSAGGRQYDVMPDGKRLLVMLPETQTKGQPHRDLRINIVLK